MNDTNLNSNDRRGFASMDPEKRSAIAKKGGRAARKQAALEKELPQVSSHRGFAAMDEEKRKQISRRGGSTSRRNRIDWKNQDSIL